MIEGFAEFVRQAREWFERAARAGWFSDAERRRFEEVERATPADLFENEQARPLVVALFGGTGVGKSSLLNRIAGAPIALVGAERPTSRETTVYVHDSVKLASLPPELPVERVQIRRHQSKGQRDVLWIDAPDIDSVAEQNRQTALAWLPHVDLLLYAVSPERYRDDVGWRVLGERGNRHGWMFVMNRWDEGDARQRDDFRRMLRGAGFEEPLLLCTSCRVPPVRLPTPDEFAKIQATIRELLEAHAVRELARLGVRARVLELQAAVVELAGRFGDEAHWARLMGLLRQEWETTREKLDEGMGWGLQTAAARFAVREGGLLKRVGREVAELRSGSDRRTNKPVVQSSALPRSSALPDAERPPDLSDLAGLTASLWDEWSQAKLVGALDAFEVATARAGVATAPIRRRLDGVADNAGQTVLDRMQDEVRTKLLKPRGLAARVARRITGFLTSALPMAALAAVGYRVVAGYFPRTGQPQYLGTEFAIHSALLVLIAWLVPFLLDRMLRPSLERAVLAALRQGFDDGLSVIGEDLSRALSETSDQARQFRLESEAFVQAANALTARPAAAREPVLRRVIAHT
jgi:hypothetical protein